MALKLLNPGVRPLGTFDLDDAFAGTLQGGEYVELLADATPGPLVEGYAADVGAVGPMGPGAGAGLVAPILWNFTPATNTSENLGGLADEGVNEYGTLYGQLIGSNTGQATVINGAVVLGPSTERASGKVTVWHAPGLYGVSGTPATGGTDGAGLNALSGSVLANDAVYASNTAGSLGNLVTSVAGAPLGCFVGQVADSSLVSTTTVAAGLAATAESFAVYYFGMSKA